EPPKWDVKKEDLLEGERSFPWNDENLKIGEQVLFNIMGDEFGENSELEGVSIPELLEYVIKFMTFMQNQNRTYGPKEKWEQLKSQLENTRLLAMLPKDMFVEGAKKLLNQAIENQKPILIPGGWTGKPGHAIYYEIIPSGTTASLRIYQLGK